jgi:hypothetical protein
MKRGGTHKNEGVREGKRLGYTGLAHQYNILTNHSPWLVLLTDSLQDQLFYSFQLSVTNAVIYENYKF